MITKEIMEKICQGKDKHRKISVNDDLESFLEDLRSGKEQDEIVSTYFLPKLTGEELELVERNDRSYLGTFQLPDPRVKKAEKRLSESDSRFVDGLSWRKTFTIKDSPSKYFQLFSVIINIFFQYSFFLFFRLLTCAKQANVIRFLKRFYHFSQQDFHVN